MKHKFKLHSARLILHASSHISRYTVAADCQVKAFAMVLGFGHGQRFPEAKDVTPGEFRVTLHWGGKEKAGLVVQY